MKSLACATSLLAVLMAVGAPSSNTPPSPTPSPEALREIAKIQELLGGSIVKGSELESLAPPASASSHGQTEANLPPPVAALRHAAWELDKSAHKLEMADLYRQADDLRALAADFRQEARDLKSAAEKAE